MSVYQQIVNVQATPSYPTVPQVVIPFEPKSISVQNENVAGAGDAFVSFDGINDQGHLIAGASIHFEQRVTRAWLRRGSAGNTDVQVLAES